MTGPTSPQPYGRREAPSQPATQPATHPAAQPLINNTENERVKRGQAVAVELIRMAVAEGASDLHIKSGEPVRVRSRNKDMTPIIKGDMEREIIMDLLYGTAPRKEIVHQFLEHGDTDYSFGTDAARVRVNAYRSGKNTTLTSVLNCA